jgi:magnesium transporter
MASAWEASRGGIVNLFAGCILAPIARDTARDRKAHRNAAFILTRVLALYPEASARAGDTIWIDLCDPTAEELEQATRLSPMRLPVREEIEEIESSSRLRLEHGALRLSMPVSAHAEQNESAPTPVGFLLSPRMLVTLRYTKLRAFDETKSQLSHASHAPTAVELFTSLLEGMVDYAADVLQQIAAELNAISHRVFQAPSVTPVRQREWVNRRLRRTMIEVGQRGERLSQIRESLLGLQRIASFTSDKGCDWIGEEVRTRLKTVIGDLASLTDFVVHLTDKVQFLLDAVLGFINTEQNDIFKVLTIVSVVGIPPTLIAGIYGMNFQSISEYHWAHGYAWGLSLILLSTILPVAWFKWRGWW